MLAGDEQMGSKKVRAIALLIGAVIVGAAGSFIWLAAGHTKTGIGLVVLGVILLAGSLLTFFSRASAEKIQLNREWM